MGRIVKGKGKASATTYSTLSSGSSQSQAAEEQHHLGKRLDAQQRGIDIFKAVIAQLTTSQSQPPPLPKDAEDLGS